MKPSSNYSVRWLFLALVWFTATAIYAQQGTIKGTIVDINGAPIIGANIIIEGTSVGTVSDIDGNYTIPYVAAGNVTVSSSFIGYLKETKDIVVSESKITQVDFSLIEDLQKLSEVVVIGYGTIKKSDLTGAVASVKPEELTQLSTNNVQQAIQGRVAGVVVTSNSGAPGDGVRVRIRGISTVNNSDPLYVVDGFPISDISYINPTDVESMEILKDASATAIYGNRGANGVILITTKKGKSQKTVVNLDIYTGILQVNKKIPVLDAEEYARAKFTAMDNQALIQDKPKLALTGSGTSLEDTLNWVLANHYKGTNWQDEILRQGSVKNYSLSVSGGSDKGTYNFSGSFNREDGIIVNSWQKRYLLRYSGHYEVFKLEIGSWQLKVNSDISMAYRYTEGSNYDRSLYGQGILPPALIADPVSLVTYPGTDQWAPVDISQTTNPVAAADRMRFNITKNDQFIINLGLNFEIIKGLTFNSKFGARLAYDRPKRYIPVYTIGSKDLTTESTLTETHDRAFSWNNSNYLNYTKEINKHSFNIMLGQEWQYFNDYKMIAIAKNGPNDVNLMFLTASPDNLTATVNSDPTNNNRYEWESSLFSYFGRINYAYGDRYLLTASLRRDGSSKISKDYRWGYFPSVSVGWNIKNEFFLKNVDAISALKYRIGWGKTGNESSINDVYSIYPSVRSGLYTLGENGEILQGAMQTVTPNEMLQWEVVTQWNEAIDFGFLGNKLTGTIDYFTKTTTGMIVVIEPPVFAGSTAAAGNYGTMENKGIELSLNYRNFNHEFKYEIGGNITWLDHPMVTKWADPTDAGQATKIKKIVRTEEGEEMAHFYGYKTDGLLTAEDIANNYIVYNGDTTFTYNENEFWPGQLKLVDLNGDKILDDKDKTNIGSANPDLIYGFNINLEYKGIDLKIFCQGVYGNEMVNSLNAWLKVPDEGNQNLHEEVLNGWTPENQNTSVPRLVQGNPIFQSKFNDYLVEDASYFRLKNIQLGYTLPNKWTQKVGVSNFRLYVSAENLLTITKYTGLDPEVGSFQFDTQTNKNNPLTQGIDDASYPIAKRFLIGLNISF